MNLSTRYMGLDLAHPVVASASPLSASLDSIRLLEDAGAAAIVMASLFEEQIRAEASSFEQLMQHGTDAFAESLSYFPEADDSDPVATRYLELITKAVASTDVPIIASLNGSTHAGWVNYALELERAGAHGIELNIYFLPTDLTLSGADVENRYVEIVKAVKAAVNIPVALKLSPYFSSVGHMARGFDALGVDALVLFNRFYQPDYNLDTLELVTDLKLSVAHEIRLPLLWIGVLKGQINASLAATSGVQSPKEVIKYLLAGADVVMSTSALLQHGANHLRTLRDGLADWLDTQGYESVDQMQGTMSRARVENPEAFERANYVRIIGEAKKAYTG